MPESWRRRLEVEREATVFGAGGDRAVATAVLNGLGWRSGKAAALCASLGLRTSSEAPPVVMARDVLNAVSGGQFAAGSPNRRFVLEARGDGSWRKCWRSDGELDELCETAGSVREAMILGARVRREGSRDECAAFVFTRDRDVPQEWLLRPVSTLLEKRNGVSVWVRPMKDLIRDMASSLGWDVPGDIQDK